eukprot:tig00001542_g9319.t1
MGNHAPFVLGGAAFGISVVLAGVAGMLDWRDYKRRKEERAKLEQRLTRLANMRSDPSPESARLGRSASRALSKPRAATSNSGSSHDNPSPPKLPA